MKKFFHQLRKSLPAIFWSLSGIALLVMLGFVDKKEKERPCKTVHISIDKENAIHDFIEKQDVQELLHCSELIGTPFGNINVADMERILKNNPFVENAEVYSSIDGKITVEVTQRNPLLRIINSNNESESFYIDENGTQMPVSDKYTPRVLIATGNITEVYSFKKLKSVFPLKNAVDTINENDTAMRFTLLDSLFSFASFIVKDTFLNQLTEQINVNKENEFEIIPKKGKFQIVIGDITDIQEKMDKLKIFYKKGLPKAGWNRYGIVNLKYKNQVVCTKIK